MAEVTSVGFFGNGNSLPFFSEYGGNAFVLWVTSNVFRYFFLVTCIKLEQCNSVCNLTGPIAIRMEFISLYSILMFMLMQLDTFNQWKFNRSTAATPSKCRKVGVQPRAFIQTKSKSIRACQASQNSRSCTASEHHEQCPWSTTRGSKQANLCLGHAAFHEQRHGFTHGLTRPRPHFATITSVWCPLPKITSLWCHLVRCNRCSGALWAVLSWPTTMFDSMRIHEVGVWIEAR